MCTPVVTAWPLSVSPLSSIRPTRSEERSRQQKIENKMVRINYSLLVLFLFAIEQRAECLSRKLLRPLRGKARANSRRLILPRSVTEYRREKNLFRDLPAAQPAPAKFQSRDSFTSDPRQRRTPLLPDCVTAIRVRTRRLPHALVNGAASLADLGRIHLFPATSMTSGDAPDDAESLPDFCNRSSGNEDTVSKLALSLGSGK